MARAGVVFRVRSPDRGRPHVVRVRRLVIAADDQTLVARARGGDMEAFVYPAAAASVFVATNAPLTIIPDNPALAPFTLEPGEIVGVTADEILPVGSLTQVLYLPLVD